MDTSNNNSSRLNNLLENAANEKPVMSIEEANDIMKTGAKGFINARAKRYRFMLNSLMAVTFIALIGISAWHWEKPGVKDEAPIKDELLKPIENTTETRPKPIVAIERKEIQATKEETHSTLKPAKKATLVEEKKAGGDSYYYSTDSAEFYAKIKNMDNVTKLNEFKIALAEALVNDSLILNPDSFNFKFANGSLYINDEIKPENIYSKYKKLYEDITGKPLSTQSVFNYWKSE